MACECERFSDGRFHFNIALLSPLPRSMNKPVVVTLENAAFKTTEVNYFLCLIRSIKGFDFVSLGPIAYGTIFYSFGIDNDREATIFWQEVCKGQDACEENGVLYNFLMGST